MEGVELRLLEERHAEKVYATVDRNRVHLRRWMPWVDSSQSANDVRAFIGRSLKRFTEHGYFQAAIWEGDEVAGVIGFHDPNEINHCISLGYWLDEKRQGRGIMTRATAALVDYALIERGLNRVEIRAARENVRSRAIPVRLGFKEEGLIRQDEFLYDHYKDSVVYGMLASEWKVAGNRPGRRSL
jgi:ribosomal-protein-serine acetyltransferase